AVDKFALAEDRIVEVCEQEDSKVLVGCGKSIPDLEIAIVNPETLTVCPSVTVGEIWVRGDSVAKGYWHRLEETEEIFRAKRCDPAEFLIRKTKGLPACKHTEQRPKEEREGVKSGDLGVEISSDSYFLRTGDLGFLDESGELFVTGRLKDLIIVRGRNLYPQDLELTAERSHDALRLGSNAAFTVEKENEEGLVIVQELEFRAKPNLDSVITAIRQAVTEAHEIEVYGVVLIKPGSIPKTSSGKIQRQATRSRWLASELSIVASNFFETQEDSEIARKLTRKKLLQQSPQQAQFLLESYLQTSIARILKRSSQAIELTSPLTGLGLDSLKVFELINQVEADLGVNIAIADLFSGLNTRSLSSEILAQLEISNATESISLKRITTNNNIHPVAFAQARLWFLDRLKTGNPAYNISFAVRITGRLEVERLEDCINQVISRQEILRTSLATDNGKPVQVINPTLRLSLSVIDVRESEVKLITTQEHQQPFKLTQLPLLRLKLLRLASEEHILLLTMHHIIADGLSAEVFMTEVAQLYQGLSVPELPIQYKDVVYWQRQWLESDSNRHLNYWQEKLKDAPPLLQLPTDKPRPAVQSYQGRCQSCSIPTGLTKQLQSLAKNQGITLFMLLLAAFKTLLYRYTGQEDILVGSPIANRNHEKIKGLIGFFVNTIVLRSNLTGNPSFSELLSQIRQVALEAYAHQNLPFDKLVEVLQPERDLSYTPLFQVMFALQDAPQLATIPGLTLSEYKVDSQIAQFDLSVSIENRNETLIASFEYNTDLFDDATITRMVSHYQNLLEGIVINPQARLSELPLLSDQERKQLLVDWNPTPIDLSQGLQIHHLFERQVAKTPNGIAVIFEAEQLTYQELNQRAEQLAIYLQSIGVKPEVIVGICIERSLEVMVAILGVLKAGGAYLPLDPAYPQERINLIIEDAQISLLLTTQHLTAQLSTKSVQAIAIDAEWHDISQQHNHNLTHYVNGDNLAYVIYTSGSTGKPKGVAIAHRSLVNFVQAAVQKYEINNCDRVLQFSTINFDASVEEIYPCLISGGTLVLRTKEMGYSPSLLLQKCREYGITILDLPTAFWHLLTMQLESNSTLELSSSIRLVIIGGETVNRDKVITWNRLVGNSCQLINTYGPTEATVVATSYKIPFQTDYLSSIYIGKPLSNVQTYILDQNLQPVPIGVWGEIHLGGMSLAREYLNNSELTKEKFIPNPLTIISSSFSNHQSLIYKTGDKARYLSNGNIEFLERIDEQVKIRGFRIEITEIEAVINQHEDIKQVVVAVQEDVSGNKNLVTYLIVKNSKENQDIESIIQKVRNYLKNHLPDYMIPVNWQVLKELPLTANGKLDRKLLASKKYLDSNYLISKKQSFAAKILPSNKQEKIILETWQELLQRENIRVNDNFFDVGGHSLLLTQVQERLEKSLHIDLAITDLFKYPSISSLANYLSQKENNLLTSNNQSKQFLSRVGQQKAALARKKQLKKARK
ncbi:MAG: amino acid adenylation domain-containing protein, partial [Waterburya sp.]